MTDDDTYLEMTCTGAGGEWWPVMLGVSEELRGCLREFACENLDAFGYGSGDDSVPPCEQHEANDSGNGCVDRADLWATSVAPVLATELEREKYVEVRLGEERIWFRVREKEER